MSPSIRAVLALAEIKTAIRRFDSGEENAADTLMAIEEACEAARVAKATERKAA